MQDWNLFKIIDDTVIDAMNKEMFLFAAPKSKVSITLLHSRSRKREVVVCRHVCMYIASYMFNEVLRERRTLAYIGREYRRDHASVMHAYKQVSNYLDTDDSLRSLIAHSLDRVIRTSQTGKQNKDPECWWLWKYENTNVF